MARVESVPDACRGGGAKADGIFPLFPLEVFPQRLGHISHVISNRALCRYELIKRGWRKRADTCLHLSL